MSFRIESDSLGPRQVPSGAYYGVQTMRALENFQITGIPIAHYPRLVQALGVIKQAAALVNQDLGLLDAERGRAIVAACNEVREGRLDEQFVVDVVQGGAGTSTNMNANEVIANRGLELLGRERGDYAALHPLDHVNLSQSTNDVYPTAVRLALFGYCADLARSLDALRAAFAAKGVEFKDMVKMGRTQLQDAAPMTLGQEFTAFAVTLGEDLARLSEVGPLLLESNLGATAIGTGINTEEGYAAAVCAKLADLTGLPVVPAADLVEATSDTGVFVLVSGLFKRMAVKLSKICNDLRLLSSGPFTGFRDIALPAVQPGSSIMPGKVNPVIPEVMNQVCYQVMGNDLAATFAAEAGQLQLNVFEPLIAHNLFPSAIMLARGCETLRTRCVEGITANRERLEAMVRASAGPITALAPLIGHEAAAAIAKQAVDTGRPLLDLVAETGLMSRDEAQRLLDPLSMTHPRPRRKA
jgi:aspartate ammonia-lyase